MKPESIEIRKDLCYNRFGEKINSAGNGLPLRPIERWSRGGIHDLKRERLGLGLTARTERNCDRDTVGIHPEFRKHGVRFERLAWP